MITLNILTDFCSYWWLWWILPFILGWFLAYTIMKKWRTMYETLTQENRKQKNRIIRADNEITQHQKGLQDFKGQLAILRGRINELEMALKNK